MENVMRIEARTFPDPAPVVRYEVDSSDLLMNLNDAWQTFAIANDAQHLMRERVLGRSLWDFVSDDTTRLVYDVILRQVRNGARSRFEYRCDSPGRRRLMEMTIAPAHAGHVIFESATICVERHRDPEGRGTPNLAPCCGWCKRARGEGQGWVELGLAAPDAEPARSQSPVIVDGMCSDCYSRVMSSIDDRSVAPAVVRPRCPQLARATRRARVVSLPSRLASPSSPPVRLV